MAASIEELSYQLTSDALAEQERTLSGLRTRAGTVVAAASISGSFLGAKANHGSLDVWAILALGEAPPGAVRFIEFHLTVPGETSVSESHALCDRLEASIASHLARASVTIHVEPQEAHEPLARSP